MIFTIIIILLVIIIIKLLLSDRIREIYANANKNNKSVIKQVDLKNIKDMISKNDLEAINKFLKSQNTKNQITSFEIPKEYYQQSSKYYPIKDIGPIKDDIGPFKVLSNESYYKNIINK